MRQGQETYGGRRSAAVSREEPGRVSALLNCAVFFVFFILGLTLLAFQVCVCVCLCVVHVCMREERPA